MRLFLAILFGLCLFISQAAYCDEVILKNGSSLHGEVIDQKPDSVILKLPEGTVAFNMSEVLQIKKSDVIDDPYMKELSWKGKAQLLYQNSREWLLGSWSRIKGFTQPLLKPLQKSSLTKTRESEVNQVTP